MTKEELQALRRAFRDYNRSFGCGCCRSDDHEKNVEVLAKLLQAPKYSDGSGYNLSGFEMTESELREFFGDE